MISSSIIPGINILSDYNIKNRVFLSSGTYWKAFDVSIINQSFDGYIPKKKWRSCTAIEMQYLFAQSKCLHFSQYIRISKLPETFFYNKEILRLSDKEHFSTKLRALLSQKAIAKIEQYFCNNFLIKAPAHSLGLRFINIF